MITNKKELKEYLKADYDNNYLTRYSPIKKFIKTLRKEEYYFNTGRKIMYLYYKWKMHNLSEKYLSYIPINCFDKGLSIAHLGCIYINQNVKCGQNVRISQNITIGSTNGESDAPVIGDNCFIAPQVCIIGKITIARDVCVGAGSVVVKDIFEEGTTWGGVPAKKISNNSSRLNIPVLNK